MPELQDGFTFGQKLLEDDDLTEEDKEAVRKDIQDLRDQFKDLKLAMEDHVSTGACSAGYSEELKHITVWNQQKLAVFLTPLQLAYS